MKAICFKSQNHLLKLPNEPIISGNLDRYFTLKSSRLVNKGKVVKGITLLFLLCFGFYVDLFGQAAAKAKRVREAREIELRQLEKIKQARENLNNPSIEYEISEPLVRPSGRSSERVYQEIRSDLGTSRVIENVSPRNRLEVRTSSSRVDANQFCVSRDFDHNYVNIREFKIFQDKPSEIFPGAFINLSTLLNGPRSYTAEGRIPYSVGINISVPRPDAPIEFRIASDFTSDKTGLLRAELRNPNMGAAIPANVNYSKNEVTGKLHFAALMNLSYGILIPLEQFGIPVNSDNSIGIRASDSVNFEVKSYMINLEQRYYSFDLLQNDMDYLFERANQARRHQNAGVVSKVIYGRRALFHFSTILSEAEYLRIIEQRLGISFTGGRLTNTRVGTSVDGTIRAAFEANITNFFATVYGGSSISNGMIITDPEFLREYLLDPNSQTLNGRTNEVPIAYQIKKLSSPNIIGVESEFTHQENYCISPSFRVGVILKSIACIKAVELGFDEEEDIFGTLHVSTGHGVARLMNVTESSNIPIQEGATVRLENRGPISNNLNLGQLRSMQFEFLPDIYDWEFFIKPKYRPLQPADVKFSLTQANLESIASLRQGEEIFLPEISFDLYEDGRNGNSKIRIVCAVFVTLN